MVNMDICKVYFWARKSVLRFQVTILSVKLNPLSLKRLRISEQIVTQDPKSPEVGSLGTHLAQTRHSQLTRQKILCTSV